MPPAAALISFLHQLDIQLHVVSALNKVLLDLLLAELLDQGWRRSGKFLYKVCDCVAVVPQTFIRISESPE
jgi:arginyl-tRNA--protein-N-Asp/Glu arginylyltransferase